MPPRWIRLKDAVKYAAMNKKRLIDLATDGTIKGAKDPADGLPVHCYFSPWTKGRTAPGVNCWPI